jgi:acyl-CoA synthetase (AMP-forming)/AMP-acid ligase II
MNLSMLLDMASDGFGDRVVVGHRRTAITASRLRSLSIGGAQIVRDARADAIVYADVNGPAFPVAMFSAARAGVPLVPLNYRLGSEKLAALAANHPNAVCIAAEQLTTVFENAHMQVWSAGDFMIAAEDRSTGTEPLEPTTEAAAVIIYTSGSTAEPKGVLLHHHHLVNYVLGAVEFGGAGEDEAFLVSVPPYHIAAVANVITNLFAGRRFIVLEQFTGQQWIDLVRSDAITNALVVPTMLARILATDGDKSVPTLRSLAYGGAAMPRMVVEEALATWPDVGFVNAYGLTETSSTISILGPDDHRAAIASTDPNVRSRLASVGRPVPNVELSIRDEAGTMVPPGEAGRIYVRGEQVSGEYTGTGSALDQHGFFDTRDEGYLDEDGFLFVLGRADDTIIRGGENIAPAEIEETLLLHPDIADAVVVGVPDAEWGQRIEAAVVPKPGRSADPDDIRAYVRTRLRGSKTPDRIVIWDELPRTETGKLVRRLALERLVKQYGTKGSQADQKGV